MSDNKGEYQELLARQSLDSDGIETPSEGEAPTRLSWLSPNRSTPLDQDVQSSSREVIGITPSFLWLAAAVATVALIDIVALAYAVHMFDTVFQNNDFQATLAYANPYIGLKELYSSGKVNSSKIEPILLRPRVSAQVFVDEPDRLAPRGERDYWSPTWGTLSPNERHLQVTPKIHTIVQFRAIDFGMEDCHLVITLPQLGIPLESGASFSIHASSNFDLFRLDIDRPIDIKKLSGRTKPKVAKKIATLQARPGGDTLAHRFSCPWSSLHTFEFACAEGEECLLDVWSSQNTTYGINIYEHQTI